MKWVCAYFAVIFAYSWVLCYGFACADDLLGLVYTPMNRHDLNLAKRRNHLANREFARRAHTITSKKRANNKKACRGWRYDG